VDFFRIETKETKNGKEETLEIFPNFIVARSRDLMVRGRSFYAVWDEEAGIWSKDEYDLIRLIDQELREFAKQLDTSKTKSVKYMDSFNSNSVVRFRQYCNNISDNSHELDDNLTFSNTDVTKSDFVSKRLPYPLEKGRYDSWDELMGILYSPEERAKIEWAIGAVVSGDAKKIQKFIVLYGPAGTGKSTVLNIIESLFTGYTANFEAKALGSNNNSFSTEAFRDNPLVAIQHDGDLSKIEDNTKLNSIISHELMVMNEKFKPSYSARVNAFLFMGTNQPVKISDAKSGIIRRLIDVHPTGKTIKANHYHTLMSKIDFELGAIAHHCLEVYREMGKNYYNAYRPTEMMLQTDVFFNFVEANYDVFKSQDGTTLRQAYSLYKEFCQDTGIERPLPQYKVREELRNYFHEFKDRAVIKGEHVRSYYSGFTAVPFKAQDEKQPNIFSLVLDEETSLFNLEMAECAAQYAKEDGTPATTWSKCTTRLCDIDTSKLHYVQVAENHIVIDFDLKDDNGEKSLEKNLQAASVWPATYAELSKSEQGVHLHYIYDGDVTQLSRIFAEGIEIKVFTGNSSLRRKLTKCNSVPITTINSGLPIKEKKMLPSSTIQSEKGLRELIQRNLKKEIHPGTKPSVDFIQKILDDAYASGMAYDVTDMRSRIMAFANNSSNRALECLKVVQKMKFASESVARRDEPVVEERLVFYDVEVYPNLFVICWKYEGSDNVVTMINPSASEVEALFKMKLVGFNNRRYDNHILYAAMMGYSNEQLYALSKKIVVDHNVSAMFGEAYNLSYCDIYEFSSKKQSLKKFEIDLGIHHMELEFPWDEPVAEENWPKVVEYCSNDVVATEATFLDRKGDYIARQILCELSGLTMNDTTPKHTAKIIFGNDRNPQSSFVYTDLSKEFPGYVFDRGVSTYRGETVGEGGYVYAEPGAYDHVGLYDIASMHPTTMEVLNVFGDEYTRKFSDLKKARIAIKRKDFDTARKMLDGRLAPFLNDESTAEALSYALKIVINIVYGLTSAKFDNPFRDPRNLDNIVAKRGALFMIELKHAIQDKGWPVVHIKTDSIKIPSVNEDPEIIWEFVKSFGAQYGYDFEFEATYDKFCLVNDAVYIALSDDKWTAVGAQFQHPFVYKTLFSKDILTLDDYCETKAVSKGVLYLDFDGSRRHVGRIGRFIPVLANNGGGTLLRVHEGKEYAVAGTKGYLWVEAETVKDLSDIEVDMTYFEKLQDEAMQAIDKFTDVKEFAQLGNE
jgi:energy-coupling factor transporter ATP-binding protein EcfA2